MIRRRSEREMYTVWKRRERRGVKTGQRGKKGGCKYVEKGRRRSGATRTQNQFFLRSLFCGQGFVALSQARVEGLMHVGKQGGVFVIFVILQQNKIHQYQKDQTLFC
jgi:hypothetical protein